MAVSRATTVARRTTAARQTVAPAVAVQPVTGYARPQLRHVPVPLARSHSRRINGVGEAVVVESPPRSGVSESPSRTVASSALSHPLRLLRAARGAAAS